MTRYHAAVWIDYQHARICWIGRDEAEIETVVDEGPVHHVHRKADHVGRGSKPIARDFLKKVAEALRPARAILITGPSRARTDLAAYLNEEVPALGKQVWDVEPMDHPSDGELIAAARKFFHSEDRMHV